MFDLFFERLELHGRDFEVLAAHEERVSPFAVFGQEGVGECLGAGDLGFARRDDLGDPGSFRVQRAAVDGDGSVRLHFLEVRNAERWRQAYYHEDIGFFPDDALERADGFRRFETSVVEFEAPAECFGAFFRDFAVFFTRSIPAAEEGDTFSFRDALVLQRKCFWHFRGRLFGLRHELRRRFLNRIARAGGFAAGTRFATATGFGAAAGATTRTPTTTPGDRCHQYGRQQG